MGVKELIFDRRNWFNIADNTDRVTANNKKFIAMPKSFTIKRETELNNPDIGGFWHASKDTSVNCIGASDRIYYFVGDIDVHDGSNKRTINYMENQTIGYVYKTDVKNVIWGGNSALIRLFIKACRYPRKVAVA